MLKFQVHCSPEINVKSNAPPFLALETFAVLMSIISKGTTMCPGLHKDKFVKPSKV